LLLASTVDALRAAGHEVDVVAAPGPRPAALAAVASLLRRSAWTLERHRHRALTAQVVERLDRGGCTAVIAEQLQAFTSTEPALRRGLPVVLRAQNVESDLWAGAAAVARAPRALLLRREAARVRGAEAAACRRAAAVAALTDRDADVLRSLSAAGGGAARVEVVRAPFPARLPAGDRPLRGAPALVLLGGSSWLPNRDQTRWFVGSVWPAVRARLPGARLHLYSRDAEAETAGVELHRSLADSRDAFAPGSILVVPARIASGLRMKVLEAWARGVAVIASPAAAAGLGTRDGEALLLAERAEDWVAAIARLHADPALAAALGVAGRGILAARHDPATVAAAWERLVEDAVPR
jgi:hypothetical protein